MVTERPWGYFVVLEDRTTHKLKRIIVNPGGKLSYQMHRKRDEYWTIIKGQGLFTLDGISQYVGPGSTLKIPAGRKHRISNESDSDLEFIEVQLGEYFGEDDIVRFEDIYGR
jgi:mannose-6-phosphate isomerase-like protein (cupin superfamily)